MKNFLLLALIALVVMALVPAAAFAQPVESHQQESTVWCTYKTLQPGSSLKLYGDKIENRGRQGVWVDGVWVNVTYRQWTEFPELGYRLKFSRHGYKLYIENTC